MAQGSQHVMTTVVHNVADEIGSVAELPNYYIPNGFDGREA
jgi:hypothetical protein